MARAEGESLMQDLLSTFKIVSLQECGLYLT